MVLTSHLDETGGTNPCICYGSKPLIVLVKIQIILMMMFCGLMLFTERSGVASHPNRD